MKKETVFRMDEQHVKSFEDIKQSLAETALLANVNPNWAMIMRTDAQINPVTNLEEPVAYKSRKLTPSESSYSIIYLEALTIIYAFKECRRMQYSTIKVYTDHSNLLWMRKSENRRVLRWAVELSEIDVLVNYCKEKSNKVDALSRLLAFVTASNDQTEVIEEYTRLLAFEIASNEVNETEAIEEYVPTPSYEPIEEVSENSSKVIEPIETIEEVS